MKSKRKHLKTSIPHYFMYQLVFWLLYKIFHTSSLRMEGFMLHVVHSVVQKLWWHKLEAALPIVSTEEKQREK